MKRWIAWLLLAGLSSSGMVFASGTSAPLQPVNIDRADIASLKRGARVFVDYCLNCHATALMRYRRVAKDLQIDDAEFFLDFLHAGTKLGDMMAVALQPDDAERWFGVVPPDLSTTARARGPDWLYTYLLSFYRDDARPTGYNNLLFPDVAMPHVLAELQGEVSPVPAKDEYGADIISGLQPAVAGRLSASDYQRLIKDLVNFMAYVAEPTRMQRLASAPWVFGYLLILLIVFYLLKREYWRDIGH